MPKSVEIIVEPDDVIIQSEDPGDCEDGVEVPWDQIKPDTLHTMVEEFVTREWSELADAGFSLEVKVEQVLQQLRAGKARVVFDLVSETCNIVSAEIRQRSR